MGIKKVMQRRSQAKVRKAIDNTKRLRALSNAERARQRALEEEIKAKQELAALKKKTARLKEVRGSTNLRAAAKKLGKALSAIDKKIFS